MFIYYYIYFTAQHVRKLTMLELYFPSTNSRLVNNKPRPKKTVAILDI